MADYLMNRLAIITTHPIQYYAPLFRLLAERNKIEIKVFYTWERDAGAFDIDFGKNVTWDIDLLQGYDYSFVSNGGNPDRSFLGVKNPDLIKNIEEWGAQAILVFGWNYLSHLRVMWHFKKKLPVLFRGDSTLLDDRPGWKRMARRFFLSCVYKHIDIAFNVGKSNKEYFQSLGLTDEQLIFAPHAIDNDRFYDKEGKYSAEAKKVRGELGIPDNDILFTFVGKFQEKKAPLLLIDAFNELDISNSHLLLVGNGILEPILKARAKGNSRIYFLDFQNQSRMPVIYRIGEVFCLPSGGPGETWGLAVNEAMACGLPVLVSDRCGCARDLVDNGINGYVFPSGDKKALTGMMRMLATDVALQKKGEISRDMIREWSYEKVASVIEKTVMTKHE